MADFTPTWELPLTRENATPARLVRGDVYNEAMLIIDERLGGLRGSLWVENNGQTTTIATKNVATPVLYSAGAIETGPFCRFCDVDTTTGELIYIGPLDRVPTVQASFVIEGPSNTTFRLSVHKNGVEIPGAFSLARIAPAASIANGSLFANVEISTDDRLRLYVANITNDKDVKVLDVTFAARG